MSAEIISPTEVGLVIAVLALVLDKFVSVVKMKNGRHEEQRLLVDVLGALKDLTAEVRINNELLRMFLEKGVKNE